MYILYYIYIYINSTKRYYLNKITDNRIFNFHRYLIIYIFLLAIFRSNYDEDI